MTRGKTALLMALVLAAFAGNPLLCRMALKETAIDPATFTSIRLLSGAVTLWMVVRWRHAAGCSTGRWWSALALFAYAALFSFAYVGLSAATGTLLLFGAVQVTMIGHGLRRGERLDAWQILGMVTALAGLLGLLLPGLTAPPLFEACLMLAAGFAWGVYSLHGRWTGDPLCVTAGNFARAVPLSLLLSALALNWQHWDAPGIWLALASGTLTSGIGYAVWYAVLPQLTAISAATAQLSVPVITALAGVALLGEALSSRLVVASVAILGGIALVIRRVPPVR